MSQKMNDKCIDGTKAKAEKWEETPVPLRMLDSRDQEAVLQMYAERFARDLNLAQWEVKVKVVQEAQKEGCLGTVDYSMALRRAVVSILDAKLIDKEPEEYRCSAFATLGHELGHLKVIAVTVFLEQGATRQLPRGIAIEEERLCWDISAMLLRLNCLSPQF